MKLFSAFSFLLIVTFTACAQQSTRLGFEEYEPVSTLVVPEHPTHRAKFPFIDVHNHQGDMDQSRLNMLASEMDKINMAVMVNLSGQGGSKLKSFTSSIRESHPNRFIVFTNINFDGVGTAGWIEKAVKQLEEDVRNGANGLKIYKNLGFSVVDHTGKRVEVDDARLDPIWQKCGDLKIPVLIHTADPRSFWDEMDENNERWLELATHPRRKRPADPSFEKLLQEQHNMFRKNRNTTFIAAHFGWMPNNLQRLSTLMDELPNVVVEFGAVIAELGRQPRASAAFFEKYQDRILFGKDSWVPSEYATYFRVLETADEYFPYHKKYHAFWRMYGMALPDNILKKIYFKNALRIIPNIDRTLFPE